MNRPLFFASPSHSVPLRSLLPLLAFLLFLALATLSCSTSKVFARDKPVLTTDAAPTDHLSGRIQGTIRDYCVFSSPENPASTTSPPTTQTPDLRFLQEAFQTDRYRRNWCSNQLFMLSDERFTIWRASLRRETVLHKTLFDSLSIAFSAAASVISTPLGQIFSAVSTGIAGIGKSYDKNFLADQTIDAIVGAIELLRTKEKTVILTNLQNKEPKDYTVSDAVRDAIQYDSLIGIDVGIAELTKNTNAELAREQKNLSAVRKQTSKSTNNQEHEREEEEVATPGQPPVQKKKEQSTGT